MTSKYCESDWKASGASALCSSHCTLMSHTDQSAVLLQVEHTSGKGAVLGGLIASSSPDLAPPQNPDHENGEKLFKGLTPQLSTT